MVYIESVTVTLSMYTVHWSRQFSELCWRLQFRELVIWFSLIKLCATKKRTNVIWMQIELAFSPVQTSIAASSFHLQVSKQFAQILWLLSCICSRKQVMPCNALEHWWHQHQWARHEFITCHKLCYNVPLLFWPTIKGMSSSDKASPPWLGARSLVRSAKGFAINFVHPKGKILLSQHVPDDSNSHWVSKGLQISWDKQEQQAQRKHSVS